MDLSSLLSDLKLLAEQDVASASQIAAKVADFNTKHKEHFESQRPTFESHSELIQVLFLLIRRNAKKETVLAVKEMLACLKILCRWKEFVLVLAKEQKHFSNLMSAARIDNGAGLFELHLSDVGSMREATTMIRETELEAIKATCNCVFHSQEFRECFRKSKCSKFITNKLNETLSTLDSSDENVSMMVKVIFLMSALDTDDRGKMRLEYKTGKVLVQMLMQILIGNESTRNTDRENSGQVRKNELDNDVTLVTEILKALFNITVNVADSTVMEKSECEDYCLLSSALYQYLIEPRFAALLRKDLVGHIANMLINIPKDCLKNLTPSAKRRPWEEQIPKMNGYPLEYELKDMSAIIVLITCLDDELRRVPRAQEDHIFSILSSLCHISRCLRLVRKYLRCQILPPLKDANVRPEQAENFKGRLVKLMTSPDTTVKSMAADFLFVLCKESPDRLVKHTGYGNAAGLLAGRGLLGSRSNAVTGDYSSDDDDSETEEYSAIADNIDPITGAVSSKNDESNPLENMTEEEKEASAAELMGLLDKLSSLDMIKPMRIGEDGRPEVVDVDEAKRIVKERLDKDSK